MSTIDIGGVKINYSSLHGLGKAIEEELVNTEDKLVKANKGVKKLRRAKRALKQMLGEQKAKPVLAASSTGFAATREPAGSLK
jgi:hypothetical protein